MEIVKRDARREATHKIQGSEQCRDANLIPDETSTLIAMEKE
jgi:hypothetical protein